MLFRRWILHSSLIAAALIITARGDERWAPQAVAGPVNQLKVAGNACGPAALLASFRCGQENWQKCSEAIPGDTDRSKLLYIIRAHGLRPSTSLRDRKRWSSEGVNAEDLTEIAGEIAAMGGQPAPRMESLLRKNRESSERHLDRLHDRLRDSLKRGFPPVLNLRRYAYRNGTWTPLDGHFVTVVMVPEKLPRRSTSFRFIYFDPWGAKKCYGNFRIPTHPSLTTNGEASPFLEAQVPEARIGRGKLRSGEMTLVVPGVTIGR